LILPLFLYHLFEIEHLILDQNWHRIHLDKVYPRSIRRGRERPFLIAFGWFGSDRITAVFHRIVNEHKRSDTPFYGRLRQYTLRFLTFTTVVIIVLGFEAISLTNEMAICVEKKQKILGFIIYISFFSFFSLPYHSVCTTCEISLFAYIRINGRDFLT